MWSNCLHETLSEMQECLVHILHALQSFLPCSGVSARRKSACRWILCHQHETWGLRLLHVQGLVTKFVAAERFASY